MAFRFIGLFYKARSEHNFNSELLYDSTCLILKQTDFTRFLMSNTVLLDKLISVHNHSRGFKSKLA